ncbi:uncharacterized protein LOC144710182 [Wolffia australiana]
MAKVQPDLPSSALQDDYVLCAGVRSGLKREFAFALRAQAELLSSPMGRTRSGKIQHSPANSTTAKRRKKSSVVGSTHVSIKAEEVSLAEASADGSLTVEKIPSIEAGSSPGSLPGDGISSSQRNHSDDARFSGKFVPIKVYARPRNPNFRPSEDAIDNAVSVKVQEISLSDSSVEGITREKIPSSDEGSSLRNQAEEGSLSGKIVPIKVYTRPRKKMAKPDYLIEGTLTNKGVMKIHVEMPERGHEEEGLRNHVDGGASAEPMLEIAQSNQDKILSVEVDVDPMEKKSTENVSSILDESCSIMCSSNENHAEEESYISPVQAIGDPNEKNAENNLSENSSLIGADGASLDDICPMSSVEEGLPMQNLSSMQSDSISLEEAETNFLVEERSPKNDSLVCSTELVSTENTPSAQSGPNQNNSCSIFDSNSVLKIEEMDESLPIIQESTVMIAELSSVMVGAGDSCEPLNDSVRKINVSEKPLRVGPKRKMELKMSKKIALSKFPSNIRELLATGLLEGLPVKYLTHSYDKQGGLRGVIKGGGILCYCASCNGLNTVSAYNFELHAGSKKKHPSDFICLENGNTIHDILRACSSAPLDMLESTIQNAISPEGGKIFNAEKRSPPSPSLCAFRSPRSILSVKSSESIPKYSSLQKSGRGRVTTKDLRLHKLVFMDDILPEGTEVAYYARGQRLLGGYIKDSGIFCHCCSTVVSPSQFEAHAGWSARRKPYLNIYTSNGVSLHELSVSLSKGRKFSSSESDDLCRICGDGGDLLLCDICPRAYHKECVGVASVPAGDWYCPCCQNMQVKDKSGEYNENAIAAGRVAGVDPIEEIFKRCIRIAKTPEADVGGCVLCRGHDFSRCGFGPRTVLLCDQCEREFHVGCLKENNLGDLKELPEGKWFCSSDCDRIHGSLQMLLSTGPENLPICPSDVILRKTQNDLAPGVENELDIRWRILSGKSATAETRSFLSKALSIFYESFDPIIDFATKKDIIPAMVYGWDLRDQDFGGMFCAVLTVNSCVVSAAILRVLGGEVAEIPLVATSREYQGKGYFQALFSCIEALLHSLKVKHLVLPAAEEAEAIWTKKFGFSKISFDQLNEFMKGIRTMIFEGTSLLHKEVSGPPKVQEWASG